MHAGNIKDENAVIVPRVLRAARDAGVKRVVLTSAFHAVGFGPPRTDPVRAVLADAGMDDSDALTFVETDLIIDGPGGDACGRSKIVAEPAAWDYMSLMEPVTLLPVAVMGPVMAGRSPVRLHHPAEPDGRIPGYPTHTSQSSTCAALRAPTLQSRPSLEPRVGGSSCPVASLRSR